MLIIYLCFWHRFLESIFCKVGRGEDGLQICGALGLVLWLRALFKAHIPLVFLAHVVVDVLIHGQEADGEGRDIGVHSDVPLRLALVDQVLPLGIRVAWRLVFLLLELGKGGSVDLLVVVGADVVLLGDLEAELFPEAALMQRIGALDALVQEHGVPRTTALDTVVLRAPEALDLGLDVGVHVLHLLQAVDVVVLEAVVQRAVYHWLQVLFRL